MAVWDAANPDDWTNRFGRVALPYFGKQRVGVPAGSHLMMQDGDTASFALHIPKSNKLFTGSLPLEWAWSSDVRHVVVLDPMSKEALARRWDDPGFQLEGSLSTERKARSFLAEMETGQPPFSGPRVIDNAIKGFQVLRDAIEERHGTDSDVVLAFNSALLLAEAGRGSLDAIEGVELDDAVKRFNSAGHRGFSQNSVSKAVWDYPIGEFARHLLSEHPGNFPYFLDPYLLIRHASGRLFQELHRRIIKPWSQVRQQRLFDDEQPSRPGGKRSPGPNYLHHTPPWFARSLVEESLKWLRIPKDRPLRALDPACGSGVFLIEMVRETGHQVGEKLQLAGMELSELAGTMTEFCVGEASRDLAIGSVPPRIRAGVNSLDEKDWGEQDVVLMNPPFKSWKDLDDTGRATVARVLGESKVHRPDLYLAFLVRAAAALAQGGVLAAIVPATFLTGKSATKVRAMFSAGDFRVRTIYLFKGFETFDATVEAAAIVVSKSNIDSPVRIVLANGHAEKATRLLRSIAPDELVGDPGIDIYNLPADSVTAKPWILCSLKDRQFADSLARNTKTKVRDLFAVRLGIRGLGGEAYKKVLLVSKEAFLSLAPTAAERKYFRPVADHIERGRIVPSGYVFYPYATNRELLLRTEKQLEAAVPTFYREVLRPARDDLRNRRSINRKGKKRPTRNWWEPSEPVTTWLAAHTPRIVSQEFGEAGKFALDESGKHAVAGGNGWCWKRRRGPSIGVLFAYLALLNSRVFHRLLKAYSTQLKWKQVTRLEGRFLHAVPLPDLSVGNEALEEIGRQIHSGEIYDDDALDFATLAAYGIAGRRTGYEIVDFANPAPASIQQPGVDAKFSELAERWREETGMLASVSRILKHDAYQEIIRMGEPALPCILRELRDRPNLWFPALKAIVGESPVPAESRSDPKKAREAWLTWGREKGLIE